MTAANSPCLHLLASAFESYLPWILNVNGTAGITFWTKKRIFVNKKLGGPGSVVKRFKEEARNR